MPSVAPPSPATRDQVDAYRFGLRRWEAALVRGDPVPLHEQVRAQRRAVAAGVVLGVLGLAAALVSAVVAPRPAWRTQDLVVGTPSGALYVVAHDPDRLVPVANAVAGRLVLAALRSAPVLTDPVLVDDGTLAEAPRTAAAAVAGAVGADPQRRVVPRWAVCDEVTPTGRLLGTTVLAGVAAGPEEPAGVAARRARVARRGWSPAGTGTGSTSGTPRSGPRSGSPAGSPGPRPRAWSRPCPRGRRWSDRSCPVRAHPGRAACAHGSVTWWRAVPPGRLRAITWCSTAGLQEVPPLVADVLAAASGNAVTGIGPEVVAGLPPVHRLDVAGWPAVAPTLREPAEAPVTCWTWSGEPGADPVGGVHLGRMPGAEPTVVLAGADGAGARVDAVAVGAGGAVRATAPGVPAGAGTVWLVSASGVANGVADEASAAALGITDPAPAPEAALRLLPTGPVLDVAGATGAVDVPAR